MISRNIFINTLVRILLIAILSVLLGYLIFSKESVRLSILCFILIILLTASLISYTNATNRKIKFFFDSIRNDDSSLFFPDDKNNKCLGEIYRSMNRVNQQIQQLKIENKSQELFFQTMLEHIAAGIITYNDEGFIFHANSSAKKYLATDVLTHLRQIERIDQKLFSTILEIRPNEHRMITLNSGHQVIQLSLRATSFHANNRDLTILSIQDIKNELDEKELESWMKLIRVLMHEIMNSITPITSLSDSLLKMYFDGEKPILPEKLTEITIRTTLQGLTVIKQQGKGLMSFVDSYRKLTHIPEPDKKLFKVESLLSRIALLYESMPKSGEIKLSFSIKEPGLTIFADQNLISLVLINLLKNALEANENNPEASIRITSGCNADKKPEICIIDNGPGISEDNIDKIFVPFYTTRQNGSGIGLSISRQIMRVHGGTLKASSVPDKETVFCLSF